MTRPALIALLMMLPVVAMAQTADNAGVNDTCGARGLQGLVGQSGEIAVMLALDHPKRVIAPGSAVTRDYRLNRINFDLDEAGHITRIWCG